MKTPGLLLPQTILFSLIIILTLSCYKITVDKNNNDQGYADSQLVGTWKITSLKSDKAHDWNGDGVTETDIYSTFDDCRKDNLYQFMSDKKGIFKISCNTMLDGTWDILDTKILIWIPQGSFTNNEELSNMTSISFNTIRKEQLAPGQIFTITTKWERQ
jgi:hypothetical protein